MFDFFGSKRRAEELAKRKNAEVADRHARVFADRQRVGTLGGYNPSSYTAPAPNPLLDPISPLSPLYIGADHSPSSSHCHSSPSHDSGSSSSSYDSGSSSCSSDSSSSSSSGGGDF